LHLKFKYGYYDDEHQISLEKEEEEDCGANIKLMQGPCNDASLLHHQAHVPGTSVMSQTIGLEL
jgi:hypothetical protein